MYERIQGTGKFRKVRSVEGIADDTELFDVLDETMRHVIHTAIGFQAAKTWLDNDVIRERLSCPTGGCED